MESDEVWMEAQVAALHKLLSQPNSPQVSKTSGAEAISTIFFSCS